MIREAGQDDIPSLMQIEERSFRGDRLTRRCFRHLLTRANAVTLVSANGRSLPDGYATVLFRRGSLLARLYSIAVLPEARTLGVGGKLLAAAERAARANGAVGMRLEVDAGNVAAQALYRRAGYRALGISVRYYENGADALRMHKALDSARSRARTRAGAIRRAAGKKKEDSRF